MRVTPWNIMKFWKRLMFPPHREDFYIDRITLKADLPWEPWLHCGVWLATLATILRGEWSLYPPGDACDWVFVAFGITSPVIGFASVWMLEHYTGRIRYIALWQRMIADAGLSISLIAYLCNRVKTGQFGAVSIMSDIVLGTAAWFMLTLVARDTRFIVATEKLAALIYKDLRDIDIGEWAEQVDDASR